MVVLSIVFVVLIILLLVIYFLLIKLPSDLDSFLFLHVFNFFMLLIDIYPGKIVGKCFGYDQQLKWSRSVMNLLLYPKKNHSKVFITTTMFDGVLVRIYVPKCQRKSDAVIIYFHGGGFCRFSIDNYDAQILQIVCAAKIVVVSVNYRLSPEHPYPFPGIDCLTATLYFMKFGYRNYSVNPQKVFLMGDSAGGNIAAVIARKISQRSDVPRLKGQILVYPWLQFVDFQTPSYQLREKLYNHTWFLSPDYTALSILNYFAINPTKERINTIISNRHITKSGRKHSALNSLNHQSLPETFRDQHFYSEPIHSEGNNELYHLLKPFVFNPDISPLMAKACTNLPPALIVTCGYDILRDEGIWYAQKLRADGVEVKWLHYERAIHGAMTIPYGSGTKMLQDIVRYIEEKIES